MVGADAVSIVSLRERDLVDQEKTNKTESI